MKRQRGFVLVAWLLTYQGVAAMTAVYLGAAAAGVDLIDKSVKLYHDVIPAATEEKKTEAVE